MNAGNLARVVAVAGACAAALGSATSNTAGTAANPAGGPTQAQFDAASGAPQGAPQPREMDAQAALGLWRSSFGAVKIEADDAHGGLQAGSVQGVWVYQRQGRQVIGDFGGTLRGNVLNFRWREPGIGPQDQPLVGDGYLVFDPSGRQYSGRWWSERHDRQGDWNGWRQDAQRGGPAAGQPSVNGAYPQGYPPPQGQGYPAPQGQPYPQGQGYPAPQGQPYPQGQGYPAPQGQPYPQGQGYPAPQGQPYPAPQGQPYPAQPAPTAPPRGYY